MFLDNTRQNTVIFFSISIGLIVICCVTFNLSTRSDFIRFYVSMCETAGLAEDQKGITHQQISNPEEVSLVRDIELFKLTLNF